MKQYITGSVIKKLREKKKMTQAELAGCLHVSDKAISKWETGKGYPDITLLEPLASALGISTIELLSGENITNNNRSFQMLKSRFYVCPVCGNIMTATGESVVSCCGITLPPLEAEAADSEHSPHVEKVEDEYYVALSHDMTREHYISFIAALTYDRVTLVKMYPEGNAEARFKIAGTKTIYYYCNRHGLYKLEKW